MIQSKVKPNSKQVNTIYKLCLLSFSLEEVEDIVLFNNHTIKSNPISIDEVEKLYKSFSESITPICLPKSYKEAIIKNPTIKLKDLSEKVNNKKFNLLKLKDLRKRKRLTREALAVKCCIEPMTIYHYEKGIRSVSLINSLVLSNFFNEDIKNIDWNL